METFRRLLAAVACLVVGVASFALSYVALRDVAVSLGAVPESMGWLVPIVIDGGVICGSAVIWSLSREESSRPVFPFVFVAALVAMSVVVNVAHAGPSPLAKTIAALPPLILLGTLELVAAQGRRLGSARPAVEQVRERLAHLGDVAAPVPAMAFDEPGTARPAVAETARAAAKAPTAQAPAVKSAPRTPRAAGTSPRSSAPRKPATPAAAKRPTRVRVQAAEADELA